MAVRRFFVNNAPTTTLSVGINSSVTSATVASVAGFPTSFPYTATFDYGTVTEEIVLVTAAVGNVLTITRAYGGTTAVAHLAGVNFDHTGDATDLDEANAHVTSTAGAHGVSGSLVGTSDSQTLTNKSLTSPTLTGTTTAATINASGVLTLSSVGTALSVTNNATISGTATLATVNASGLLTLSKAGTALSVTNNVTIGGTEAVTGASTAASYSANGNGTVTGVMVPKNYTNEAAAGTQAAGTVVYLTAPTYGLTAGLFISQGAGVWAPYPGSIIGTVNGATAYTSTGATEILAADLAITINVIAGRNYFIDFGWKWVTSVANDLAVGVVHASQSAITTGSPVVAAVQQIVPITGANTPEETFRQLWTPGVTGAWNLQPGVKRGAGTGNSQITGGNMNKFLTISIA